MFDTSEELKAFILWLRSNHVIEYGSDDFYVKLDPKVADTVFEDTTEQSNLNEEDVLYYSSE